MQTETVTFKRWSSLVWPEDSLWPVAVLRQVSPTDSISAARFWGGCDPISDLVGEKKKKAPKPPVLSFTAGELSSQLCMVSPEHCQPAVVITTCSTGLQPPHTAQASCLPRAQCSAASWVCLVVCLFVCLFVCATQMKAEGDSSGPVWKQGMHLQKCHYSLHLPTFLCLGAQGVCLLGGSVLAG